jgi:hypothetical protein
MPFDGSGNFIRTFPPGGWQGDATAGIKIRSDRHDQHDQDLASGLSVAICKDGQSSITADIPWGGKKIINLGPGIAPTDAVNLGQIKGLNTASDANPGGIVVSGSYPSSLINFTGSVGPWGLGFPDMYFGVRAADGAATPPTLNRFIWNDKVDATGRDLMELRDTGRLFLNGQTDEIPPGLTLTTKAADASGPSLTFQHMSPSMAANDYIGTIAFNGKNNNSTPEDINYANIIVQTSDAVDGTEDGAFTFQVMKNGALTNLAVIGPSGLAVTGNITAGGAGANGSVFNCGVRASNAGGTYPVWHGQPGALVVDYAGPASDYGSVWSNRLTTGGAAPCLWLWSSATCGTVFVNSNGTTNYNTTSDIRTKGNVKTASAADARALLDALHVIEYDPEPVVAGVEKVRYAAHEGYEPASADPIYFGLSAQQAYTVYPPAVTPAPTLPNYDPTKQFREEGFTPWQIDHSKFVPMLISALQEANARIDALEARIAVLEGAP